MTKGPRLPLSASDTASSMSTNTFGQPLTDSSVVGKSGFLARENCIESSGTAGFLCVDQWAAESLRAMLERCRAALIRQHMADAQELGRWGL